MKNEGIIMKIFTTLVVVLLAVGCTQAPQTDLEGLKAMRDVWQSAYDAKDAALITEIYSENGAMICLENSTLFRYLNLRRPPITD